MFHLFAVLLRHFYVIFVFLIRLFALLFLCYHSYLLSVVWFLLQVVDVALGSLTISLVSDNPQPSSFLSVSTGFRSDT